MPRKLFTRGNKVLTRHPRRLPMYCYECPPCGNPWIYFGYQESGTWQVSRVPPELVSSTAETVFSINPGFISKFTMNDTTIYYSREYDPGDNLGVEGADAEDGANPVTIFGSHPPARLNFTHDDAKLYYGTGGQGLNYSNFDGTGETALLGNFAAAATGLHAKGSNVYFSSVGPNFTSDGAISYIPKAGGSRVDLILDADTDLRPLDIWVTDDYIYWCDTAAAFQGIRRCDLDGSNQTDLYDSSGLGLTQGLTSICVAETLGWIYAYGSGTIIRTELDGTFLNTYAAAGSAGSSIGLHPWNV